MMQSDDAPPAPPIPLVAQPPPATPAKLLPYSLFDVVLDLSHPGSSRPNATEVIYTPTDVGAGIVDTLPLDQLVFEFGPETTSSSGGSQPPSQGGAKIARFAFPEYEDRCNAQEVANRHAVMQRTYGGGVNTSPGLNRHDLYLEEAFSLPSDNNGGNAARSTPLLPSYHVFSHRLANGAIVHGHVRRYLSPREDNGRSDVGRRSIRAIVILTRNPGGGGRLYMAMLKTLEVLRYKVATDNERRWFLHSMFREHVNLCRDVGSAIMTGSGAAGAAAHASPLSKPRIITLPLLETGRGHGLFGNVDTIKFACPPSFLHEREPTHYTDDSIMGLSRNDMMPMLRCLGVVRTMRLLSALVSERRVILTSGNVSKLSAVGYGAMSMLGQGMLPPPSVFVPVLPPGLSSLLSTPSAYVIGVLRGSTPHFVDLRSLVPSLGEVVIFDLDSLGNEPYFANTQNPAVFVPDLTRRSFEDVGDSSLNGMSLPDMLYQDLSEVIKSDKRQMFWQGAVQEKLGMAAEKGKTAAKAAMKKGLKYLKDKKRAMDGKEVKDEVEEEDESADLTDNANALTKLVGKGNYFYEQGFPNESAEVEARIAFATFFVSLFGDMRAYLTQSSPGVPPVADRDKFIKYRQANGDLPGSPMYNLVGNFLRSNLYDQFVNARLRELQLRRAVPEDAPLFPLTANYHRSNKIDFVANNIRQSVRQVAMNPTLPGKYLTSWNEGIRRRVLDLTSTQTFNGDPMRAISLLIEDCHESSTILIDAVMILWTRIQEGKGMQWKKALLALQVFRDLLLNGPISMIAEAIDGFASIRIMRSYSEALRGQNSLLVRSAAAEVYNLVADLPVLFARRRECLNKQRLLKDPKPSPLRKETRMIKGIAQFRNVHIALRPAGATVAPAPPSVTVNDLLGQDSFSSSSSGRSQPGSYSSDLLSLGFEAIPKGNGNQPNPFDMVAMTQNVPLPTAPATNNASPPNDCASPPHSNNEVMPRSSPTSFMQQKQQEMTEQQTAHVPFPSQRTIQQETHHPPFQGSAALHAPPIQQQQTGMMPNQGVINQPPFQAMQRSVAQQQMYSPHQSQPTMASFIQPQIQHQPQQWCHASPQPMPPCQPQGYQVGIPPSGGFQNAMQPPQFSHGLQKQPEQQKTPPLPQQQSRQNFSMFDPMAK
eukprot:CCRYP_010488-RA/>CCRYP_010488-RA protein AED:0.00 eAED:0.00 QI:141/1/1/1/0/0/2/132/1155